MEKTFDYMEKNILKTLDINVTDEERYSKITFRKKNLETFAIKKNSVENI